MKWPTNKEQHAYMKKRQAQNRKSCSCNRNENWMFKKLRETRRKWTRQAQWGFRLFDFWNRQLGIAIEVDGREHNKHYDQFKKSGILVLRVRNKNEKDAGRVLNFLKKTTDSWNSRRIKLRLKPISGIG